MNLIDLLPRINGLRQVVCCSEHGVTMESDVLILPDSTYFGWRLFIEEHGKAGLVAEHAICKNTDEWGWEDEIDSNVPDSVREFVLADLERFKELLSNHLGIDVRKWEPLPRETSIGANRESLHGPVVKMLQKTGEDSKTS